MYNICVFAGTTEGRELVSWLSGQENVRIYACAATEYGGELLEAGENVTVSARRLTEEDMDELFSREGFACVVDATHPYAPVVTENIRAACGRTGVAYLRLLRDAGSLPAGSVRVANTAEAVRWLEHTEGNVLLTTGSKELAAYSAIAGFDRRFFARVLPVESSIAACREAGVPTGHILAMQGPFSTEMNLAMIQSFQIRVLVTKESGSRGGFAEKAEAAARAGIPLLVIGRPEQVEGLSFGETVVELCRRFGLKRQPEVRVIGIGPGDRDHQTLQAAAAMAEADCLIGAKRMLEAVAAPGQLCCEAIAPEQIRQAILDHPECRRFAVVMAGDIGFYSGTKKLLPLLADCRVTLVPGLSSLVCLCARLGTSYEDVVPVSLHGRQADIVDAVRRHGRVFALVGGTDGMKDLCARLTRAGFGAVQVSVGERLCYPDEKITCGTAESLSQRDFHSLSVCLIEGGGGFVVTHGLPDDRFHRGSHADGSPVPMTKSEIRSVSLSRLRLTEDAVCWDIGAGSGSVAIEMALQAPRGQVYAIEKKPAALELLRQNARELHAENVTAVAGAAPEACEDLPAPTHVFVGGSSGNMRQILELCRRKNPHVRVVATAIALETVAELTQCRRELGFAESDVACVTVAQGRQAGSYTLMQGQNPVYVFTFQG